MPSRPWTGPTGHETTDQWISRWMTERWIIGGGGVDWHTDTAETTRNMDAFVDHSLNVRVVSRYWRVVFISIRSTTLQSPTFRGPVTVAVCMSAIWPDRRWQRRLIVVGNWQQQGGMYTWPSLLTGNTNNFLLSCRLSALTWRTRGWPKPPVAPSHSMWRIGTFGVDND